MSMKDLLDAECGGANPLMRLGGQITRDAAIKSERNDYFGQNVKSPDSFHMDVLLKEMREIDAAQNFSLQTNQSEQLRTGNLWANDFAQAPVDKSFAEFWAQSSNPSTSSQAALNRPDTLKARNFFENAPMTNHPSTSYAPLPMMQMPSQNRHTEFFRFMDNPGQSASNYGLSHDFFNEIEDQSTRKVSFEEQMVNNELPEDWSTQFEEHKKVDEQFNENYNKQFWERLQDEWKKLSEDNGNAEHPWLNEFSDYYDPYKEYKFDDNNPMINVENAFEKGKQFLAQGDVPSAVTAFEAAVKQEPENPEIWEYLGISQAENEKDPNAIAALKKCIELKPDNMKALMALAISFTNESLQNQALKMLVKWMKCNLKYSSLIPPTMITEENGQTSEASSSLIDRFDLEETQLLFLRAVQQNAAANMVDHEIQEALGVLFNLSSEFDKAADCFQSALQVVPNSAKLWNRLGASLANGNRAVEAVNAYQKALEIEPGFVRARYNVGIICINLKSYKEAAEHFLIALNHQANSKNRSGMHVDNVQNQMSETVWSTLRMSISLLGRNDLQPAIDKRDLDALNKEFGM